MDGPAADSPLAGRMVFVVGARRSGTNWIQRILGAHPGIAVVPSETHLFSHGIAPLVDRFHQGAMGSPATGRLHMDAADLHAACRQFCDRVFAPYLASVPGARLLVERTPWHAKHLDLIGAIYPDARVVHIVRDGRDVARSLVTQQWGDTRPGGITDAADEWRGSVLAVRASAAGLAAIREVRYEELLANPTPTIADLFGWLEVDADEAVLAAAVAESGVPFNVDPAVPGLASGKWRTELTGPDVEAVMDVAGDALRAFGYLSADGRQDDPGAGPDDGPADRDPVEQPGVVGGLARVLRRGGRRSKAEPTAAGASAADMEAAANLVDDFLAAVHNDRAMEVERLATDDVDVRIVASGSDWSGRGPPALRRLVDTARRAGLASGRQRRGDVHPGAGTFAVVLTYEDPTGRTSDALFVLHPGRRAVRGVTMYCFPLQEATGGEEAD